MELPKNKLASCLKQKFTLPVTSAHLSDKTKRDRMVSLAMPNIYYNGYWNETVWHVGYQYFSFISVLINIKESRNTFEISSRKKQPNFEIAIIISCLLWWVTWLTLLQWRSHIAFGYDLLCLADHHRGQWFLSYIKQATRWNVKLDKHF